MKERDILNYLKGRATKEEQRQMEDWLLASYENLKRFYLIKAVSVASGLRDSAKEVDTDKGYAHFENTVSSQSKSSYHRLPSIIKYAAVAILLLGVGYLFQQDFFDSNAEEVLIPVKEAITLELEDGTIEVINPEGSKKVRNVKGDLVGNQNKTQLVYNGQSDSKELVFNTLKVPYGKRFDVILSDGTRVYMNSGTTLKYPIAFLEGVNREIFLTGEAYFDVTSDVSHPFIVNAEKLKVAVLGTQFNVLAYPEDTMTDVILVEGSVGLHLGDVMDGTVLYPGQKGILNRRAKIISTQKVNTNIYTTWRTGELIFRKMSFENLAKKLERYYNIEIEIENDTIKEEIFSGSFNNETIETVLHFLSASYNMDYIIKNNTVYIR